MKIKDHIKKALYKLGKVKVLPATVINSVKIVENHDQMINIKDDPDFFFDENLQKEEYVYLRQSVYDKLKKATLPNGYYFKIMSAYRSIEDQKERWNLKCAEIRKKYPNISEDALIAKVRALCADPRAGFGGHQTGGAIDITLCDNQGNNYDMGTAYRETSPQIRTDSSKISQEQTSNRLILVDALKQLDFANYPLEWWHHSYGDRLWAAYKNRNTCVYGLPAEKEFEKTRQTEQNDISITFSVPQTEGAKNSVYKGELVLNELRGSDVRNLAKIACDMAFNDTLKLLLKTDAEKQDYEQFIHHKAPDLLNRWHEIMEYRPKIIKEAEKVLNKPFAEMTPLDKSRLFNKIDKNSIPLECWHINFPQLSPDLKNKHNRPEDAFLASAQEYVSGAAVRRQGNNNGLREGFWLAIRDKESNKLLGVMALSTKITRGNLIGHSARFLSPEVQRQKIGATAGFVALDFMYKYLIDKEQPDLYQQKPDILFDTTCHPFNTASRGLQGHNGAKFSEYNPEKHKLEFRTTRASHAEVLDAATPIFWKAQYKNMEINSETGTKYPLNIKDKEQPEKGIAFYKKTLTKVKE